MPEKIFCYLPIACLDPDLETTSQVRRLLSEALSADLAPGDLPKSNKRQAVLIDDEPLKRVKALAAKLGVAPGRVVGSLLYANHLRAAQSVTNEKRKAASVTQPNLQGLRPGQSQVLIEAAPKLLKGQLVFSECGTGSGKARLICHTADFLLRAHRAGAAFALPDMKLYEVSGSGKALPEFLQNQAQSARDVHTQRMAGQDKKSKESGCIVICAPSVENVSHLVNEWLSVRATLDPSGLYRTATRLGRGQFVDPFALDTVLADSEHEHPCVQAWIDAGMPAGKTRATKALLAIEPGLRGLVVDLEQVTTGDPHPFDFKACVLDEHASEEDQSNYLEHKARASEDPDILFTTTSMLCLDNFSLPKAEMTPLLPTNILSILIDEGDVLESVQADLAAKNISLSRLRADLRVMRLHAPEVSAKAIDFLARMNKDLQAFPNNSSIPPQASDFTRTLAWQHAVSAMKDLLPKLREIKKAMSKKPMPGATSKSLRSIERAESTLDFIVKTADQPIGARGIISQSPVRGMISITLGPNSIEKHLMGRWAVTPCAMILSGSLFHIAESGPNAKVAASQIGAENRFSQTIPLHPSWLFSTPTLYQPGLEEFHRFMPPKADEATPAALAAWLENCALAIAQAARDAKGGTLVLMTGYERLGMLGEALRIALPDPQRLLIQSQTTGASAMKDQFIALAKQGERPIWIATGAAWTGLDLSDKDVLPDKSEAHKDNILTDLIIPALPFGLDRTTTHAARLKFFGFSAEIATTQRKLRQGLGRLVRREGVLNRRIWLLDGRLVNPAAATYTMDLRRVLLPYLKRSTLSLE